MAMIECKSCGKRVSTKKKTCRYCGAKVGKSFSFLRVIGGVFVVLVLMIFVLPAMLRSIANTAGRMETKRIVDTSVDIQQGEFFYQELGLNGSGTLNVLVEQSGSPVDVYFLTESAYRDLSTEMRRTFISGAPKKVAFNSQLSKEGLSGRFRSGDIRLSKGSYYLVIDNSAYGSAKPTGVANVKITVDGK